MFSREDSYLEAQEAKRNANYLHAKQLLKIIILDEPATAQGYNPLGWLYHTHFDDGIVY